MTIRWKLFLIVGFLILLICASTFFLPNYLVRQDLEQASDYLDQKINTQQAQILEIIDQSIEKYFKQAKQNLKNVKTVILQSEALKQAIKKSELEQLTKVAEQILSIDSELSFVKINSIDSNLEILVPENLKEKIDKALVTSDSFLTNDKTGDIFFTEQFSIDSGQTMTLGDSISNMVRDIAKTYNRFVLFHQKEITIGYNQKGEYVPFLSKIPYQQLKGKQGSFLWNDTTYIYQKTALFDHLITLYFFVPLQDSLSIGPFLKNIEKVITKKISFDLSTVVLVVLILALGILEWLSKKMTQPIVTLANATKKVSEGHFELAELPQFPHSRNDEISTLYHSFSQMVANLKDREKIRGVLNKVVSKEIADEILKRRIKLEGEQRWISIFFSDIRGFTNFSEKISTFELFETINTYFNLMCQIIDQEKGVVDKFVGDEIMALYGTPIEHPHHAYHAVNTAIQMMNKLNQWNQERAQKNLEKIEIGIGIHTGTVFAGNVGAQDRLNYTVLGANVNLASRLCSTAKPMQILISHETLTHALQNHQFIYTALPPMQLKGIDQEITAYEVNWN